MVTMIVRIHTRGGPKTLVYEDAPRPEPAPDEVLIRIYAASVNPVDWNIRDGGLVVKADLGVVSDICRIINGRLLWNSGDSLKLHRERRWCRTPAL